MRIAKIVGRANKGGLSGRAIAKSGAQAGKIAPAAAAAVAMVLGSASASHAATAAGIFTNETFSSANQISDTNVSLNANKTYQATANINGTALTINGVAFGAGATSGTNWALAGASSSYTTNMTAGGNNNIATTNQLYTLATVFTYGGNPGVFTLSNLTAGQVYTVAYYGVGFGAAGQRVMSSITGSDGGTIANFDEDEGGAGNGYLLRYTFVAQGATESLTFTPTVAANTFHFYGFTNEQVFNDTFQSASGSNWSTASYSTPALAPTAGAAGTNVTFPQQSSASTVVLDANETVGHVQFNSTNGWSITGSSTLTIAGDTGGVSVLSAPNAGNNTIAVPLNFSTNVAKFGAGTIVFTNATTSNGNSLTIGADGAVQFGNGTTAGTTDGPIVTLGSLNFAEPTAYSYGSPTATISGTGNLVQAGPGTVTLTNTNTFTGTTSVTGGVLTVGSATALQDSIIIPSTGLQFAAGIGFFTVGGITGSNNFPLLDQGSSDIGLTIGANNLNATYTGNLSGANASITKVGSATQVFTGTNTYTGTTAVNAGTLEGAGPASLPAATTGGNLVSVAGGATLALEVGAAPNFTSANIDAVRNDVAFASGAFLGLDTTTAVGGTFTYSSGIADSGSGPLGLNKLGAGTLVLGGTNSFTGGVNVQNGTLQFSGSGTFTSTTSALTLGTATTSGVLALGDAAGPVNATFASLTSAGTGNAIVGGASSNSTFTLNNAANTTFTGLIGGTGTNQNNLALVKGGAGTLALSGLNTYTGPTTINVGTLATTSLANGGAASSIGASTNSASNLVLNGGFFQYLGSTAATTDRLFTLNASAGIDSSGSAPVSFTNTGAIPTAGAAAATLTLQGSNTGANTLAASLADNGSLLTSFTKGGAGTWDLASNASTYTGVTTIGGGILNVASLANYGVASSLGARLASQESGANVGIHFTGGTLQYTGSTAQSTNRQIRVSTAGGTIDASGSSPTATVSFTYNGNNTDFFDTAGNRTLTFTGSNTGGNLFDIDITNQSTNITTVYKTGVGTWILGGKMGTTDSGGFVGYTGGTNVQNGTLQLASTGSLSAAGGLTLGSGTNAGLFVLGDTSGALAQTFTAIATSGTAVTNAIVSGSTGISTVTVKNAAADTYNGVLGGGGTNQNNIGLTLAGSSTLTLAPSARSTYVGPTIVSAGTLAFGAPAGGQALHLPFDGNANDTSGNANNATLVNAPAYTTGVKGQAISFNGSNQYATVPDRSSLNATGSYTVSLWEKATTAGQNGPALLSTRNGGDYTFDMQISTAGVHGDFGTGGGWINTSANATATLGTNWNMITYAVGPTSDSIYINGVLSASSTYNATTPAFMTTTQTLSIGAQEAGGTSYGTFFNGAIDEVNLYPSVLTPAQINTLYLSTLYSATGYVLPTNTPLTVANGATMDLVGNNQTVASISDFTVGSGGTITNSAATTPVNLIVNPASGSTTFSGTIIDGGATNAISLFKSGLGTQILAGVNTYSGPTTVSGGTLAIGVNNAVPATGGLAMTGGTFNSNGFKDSLGALTLAGPATFQFGAVHDTGNVLTFSTGAFTSGALSVTDWDGNSAGNGADQFLFSGAIGSGLLASITFVNPDVNGTIVTGSFPATTVANGANTEIVPSMVPEPASLALLGLAGLGLLKRRRRPARV